MADSYLRQSPLAHLHLIARAEAPSPTSGVRLSEIPYAGQFVLRGDAQDKTFQAALEEGLGQAPALEPNTVSGPAEDETALRILWLGPDEWLVVGAENVELGKKLEIIADGRHVAVSDVSESRAILKLSGARARDVLAKGCALDLHPSVFGPGQCAQSMLAQAHVILHQTSEAPDYDIYVHRSFAEHLWAWLEDASAEYGLAIGA